MKCKTCNGKGKIITYPLSNGLPDGFPCTETCPDCNGTGKHDNS